MGSQTTIPTPLPSGTDAASVALVGAFLLRISEHEQAGLSYRNSVLAAASECGVNPAVVLGHMVKAAS